jgi:glutathione S-transferase
MLRLVTGNLNYSSWSVRPWLALKQAGAEFELHDIGLRTGPDWKERVLSFSGAGKVPVLVDGALTVHESLAICEYVAELYPRAGLWPDDRQLRARGRAISCEMLTSFSALRSQTPMNLRARTNKAVDGAQLRAEISRVREIWEASLVSSGGPFLLGRFSIADCMFFPVATRFRTYGVELPPQSSEYCRELFGLPYMAELEAIASAAAGIPQYDAAL